jgi:hypothetical protein
MRYYKILKITEQNDQFMTEAFPRGLGWLEPLAKWMSDFLTMVFGKNAENDKKKDAETLADTKLTVEEKMVKIYNDHVATLNNLWPEANIKQYRLDETVLYFNINMLNETGEKMTDIKKIENDRDANAKDIPADKDKIEPGKTVTAGQVPYYAVYINLFPITKDKITKDSFHVTGDYKILGYASHLAADKSFKIYKDSKKDNISTTDIDKLVKAWFAEYNKPMIDKETGTALFSITPTSINANVDVPQPLTIAFDKKKVASNTGEVTAITKDNFKKFKDKSDKIVKELESNALLKSNGPGTVFQYKGTDGKIYQYVIKRFAGMSEYPLYLYVSREIDGKPDVQMNKSDTALKNPNFKKSIIKAVQTAVPQLTITDFNVTSDTPDNNGGYNWAVLNPSWELKKS